MIVLMYSAPPAVFERTRRLLLHSLFLLGFRFFAFHTQTAYSNNPNSMSNTIPKCVGNQPPTTPLLFLLLNIHHEQRLVAVVNGGNEVEGRNSNGEEEDEGPKPQLVHLVRRGHRLGRARCYVLLGVCNGSAQERKRAQHGGTAQHAVVWYECGECAFVCALRRLLARKTNVVPRGETRNSSSRNTKAAQQKES